MGAGTQTVLFEELEPVLDSVPALSLVVNGTSEANAINYAQGAVATNGKVTVDSYESIEFSNKTTLTINALAGSDSVSLNNASTPTGLTGITVNAGDPTGSDTLIVTGTGAADTFTFVGTSASSGTVARIGTPLVTFTGVEHTTLDGQGGDDTFKVGSDFGNVNIIGGDGSDTIDFSGSTKAVVFDMDLLNVAQRVSSGQEKVTLGEPIENFIGTDFNDIIRVQIAAFDRTINGGVETVIPPGDELIVDVQGHAPKITKVPNGKLGSFDGTVNATGYTGTISYFDIETLAIKNGPPTGGFGGAFAAATDYLVGKSPRGVALGQLNDDNLDGFVDDLDFLDMVVANADSRTVTVRMGEAFGLFGPATNYATGGKKPTTVQLADLDEDGTLDIALVNRDSNTLSVLLNDGSGSFGAFTLFSTNTAAKTGRQPYSVKLADVNRDTHIDAVIANAISGTVSVLLGVGDGTFGPATTFTTGGKGPRDLVIGDFNNDGFADLVTTNIYSKNASFLAGDGSGTFLSAPQLFAVGTEPSSIVAADFNADGNLDVAISNQRSNTVSILLGNGAVMGAQFREELRIHYPGNKYAISIAAGDFNGDGNVDLVVANQRGNTLSILLGLGNGSFTNPVNFSVGDVRRRQPVSVAVGDFNHDGFLDVLVANGGTNDVSVLLRNPIA